jgi:rhomboid family GlyGly-CTERM serine protease
VPSSTEDSAGGASHAWVALAAALAGGACTVFVADTNAALDWQPSLVLRQPWRAWTAAWVHFSALHLAANLTGCALVAALGIVARVPLRIAVAWLIAWPLTQLGLLLRPDLLHYGGLSGVLHAGVAALSIHLIVSADGARRLVGVGLLAGLAIKVGIEAPWEEALRHPPGWDIAVAPFAHASGLVAGAALAAVAEALRPRSIEPDD